MGIERYALTSGVMAVVCQRLVRKLCQCARPCAGLESWGLGVKSAMEPVGCDRCRGTGYRGRLVLSEMLAPSVVSVRRTILQEHDVTSLEGVAVRNGMTTLWDGALEAVESGRTSPAELRRTLGFGGSA